MSILRYDLQDFHISLTRHNARLLYMSQEKFMGDWHSIEHTHSCSELFYIIEGNGFFSIENQICTVSANDLVIINPNIVHTEIGIADTPMKYIVLGIEGLELSLNRDEKAFHHHVLSFKPVREQTMFLLQNLLTEINQKSPRFEELCQHYLELLILLVNRQSCLLSTPKPIKSSSARLAASVRRFIDDHYREYITLNQLAEVSHANKYHIVHTFTEEYGISPINYLIARRIEEGEKLLTTTDFSLSAISRFCGFSSPSYFAQVFKRQRGHSPSSYRKKSRMNKQ
ncbi:MAG: helix-turn-helix domain-containing protein [Lachnospiraceae bacterium]